MPDTPSSPAVDALVNRVSALLVAWLDAHKDEVVGQVSGFLRRLVLDKVWGALTAEIPTLTAEVFVLFSDEFGSMTLDQILEAVAAARVMKASLARAEPTNGA